MSARWRRALAIVGLLALLAIAAYQLADQPLPQGQSGARADALAHSIQTAVDIPAWQRTGAVRWTFADRHHLWDRQRGLARVQWNEFEVQLDLQRNTGLVWRAGEPVKGGEASELIATAKGSWINDSFWLNPLAKLFDPGTTRQLVRQADGREDLLLTYTTGGNTPGDSYLWLVGPNGRPEAWRMWVSIIPLGGLEASWQQWTQLATDAWISQSHQLLFFTIRLENVAGSETLAALVDGADPLAAIVQQRR